MDRSERPSFHVAFSRALAFATELHAIQLRKQTDIPYISHLIGVAGIVLENGGTADEAIVGLLHDSIEDCGVKFPGGVEALRAHIRASFGPAVLAIVEGCTDAETLPKPPWRARKAAYLAHLVTASPSVRLVSCSDKLHNARAIVSDLRVMGNALFAVQRGAGRHPLVLRVVGRGVSEGWPAGARGGAAANGGHDEGVGSRLITSDTRIAAFEVVRAYCQEAHPGCEFGSIPGVW